MQKIIKTVLALLASTVITLSVLVATFDNPTENNNGFNRTWISKSKIRIIAEASTEKSLTKLCGSTGSTFYLSDQNAQIIVQLDASLQPIGRIPLSIPASIRILPPNKLIVDSPYIYLHANNHSAIIVSKLNSRKVDSVKLPVPVFLRSSQINDSIAVLYFYDHLNRKFTITSLDFKKGTILQKQHPFPSTGIAGFEDDGMLLYNSHDSSIFFVQYYKNRFICMDDELNIRYYTNTIGTTSSSEIRTARTRYNNKVDKITPANSRFMVNKKSAVSEKFLLILSGFKSNNQTVTEFRNTNVFDLYHTDSGRYMGSFLLPKSKNKKIHTFHLKNNVLTILYNSYIASYHLYI